MTRNDILTKLKEAISNIQEKSGENFTTIMEKTCPIGGLPGFDSLRAVEVTVELGDLLNKEIGGDVNLFISKDGSRALKLNEIVDKIYRLVS